MAFNPMQQQQSPDMLMAMMTDPRATPQQRMAAMSALNTMRGGANAPQPPQMTGDSTGVSQMSPAFMAAVRQEMMGQGPEEQPEIPQRQAAPEAPQESSTAALMSGAADASRVAAMAHGGAVRHYLNGTDGNDPSSYQADLPPNPTELFRIATTSYDSVRRLRAKRALDAMRGQAAPPSDVSPLQEVAQSAPEAMRPPPAPMQNFDVQLPFVPEVNIDQTKPDPTAGQKKPARTGGKDYYALLEKMAEEGDDGEASKKDKYMALLQAGLATMAAASQPGAKFLGSIGQGGLMGVKGLEEARAARAQDRMKKMTLYGTLAGRQEASEAAAAALAQRKEEKVDDINFRKEEGKFNRDAAGERADEANQTRITLGAPLALIAQQNADSAQAAKEAAAAAAKEKLDNPKMSSKMEGAVQTYTQTGMNSNAEAISAENLANRFETETPSSGFFGGMGKVWKQFTGNEDYVSQLRNEYTHFKNTGIISFLPKGAASDKDVVFASAGFLPDTADPKIIAQWLRGHAKLKKYESELSYANAEFLSKNRDMGVTKRDLNISGIDVKQGTSYPSFMKNYLSQVSVPGVEYDKNPSGNSGTAPKPGNYKYDLKTGEMILQ